MLNDTAAKAGDIDYVSVKKEHRLDSKSSTTSRETMNIPLLLEYK